MIEFKLQGAEEHEVAAEAEEIRRLRDRLGPTGNTTSPCRWCGVAHNPLVACAVADLLFENRRLREENERLRLELARDRLDKAASGIDDKIGRLEEAQHVKFAEAKEER